LNKGVVILGSGGISTASTSIVKNHPRSSVYQLLYLQHFQFFKVSPPSNFKMHAKFATFLLPVLAAANPVPAAGNQVARADAPDPAQITIVDSTYSGNGCPQGSVSTSTSTDKTVRRVLMFSALIHSRTYAKQ
jgi:hypothetical protein